jgi:hypothetical protein
MMPRYQIVSEIFFIHFQLVFSSPEKQNPLKEAERLTKKGDLNEKFICIFGSFGNASFLSIS